MRAFTFNQISKRLYSQKPAMPPCNFTPKEYKGPSYDSLIRVRKERLSPALVTYYSKPFAVHQGHMQWLFDLEGKRYLDLFGGICTVSVGHCHPEITEAVAEQMSILGHVSNVYLHPKVHKYAEQLTDKFSGDLKVVYFVNSGAEANELAMLMARTYTQNFEIISLRGAYHGMTNQTMNLTASSLYRHPVPSSPGFHYTMTPDVYRGIWGGKHCRDSPIQTNRHCTCSSNECEASTKYLEQLEEVYRYSIPKGKAAAFFAESIQGVGGSVQYPRGYLKGAYNMIKKCGGVFVADEVQTGFGRTGEHYWGFEMHDIVPDIVTMAKGIGNGFPLAAVVTTSQIAQSLTKAQHFNTFGGNPLASVAGMKVLEIIQRDKLQENSKRVGTHLLLELDKLRQEFPVIGDVRGVGLMIGIEMVAGDGSRTPLEPAKVMKYWERCLELGIVIGRGGYFGHVFRIKPPMCITKEDADFTVAVMKTALREMFSNK
uniref:Alanine--glyoxylate aminotransferase 2, mitochondrial n=1 Tax=Photinus pyralis TaxID=7054 RepID=A0A1Y1KAE8_PHOPY